MEWRLLRGLSEQERRLVIAGTQRHRYRTGEVVFHEGDLAESIHFVAEGRLVARRTTPAGDNAAFAVMGPGEAFGEMAMLSPQARRTSTVAALEPAVTLTLRYAEFDRLRVAHPGIERLLVDVLAERVLRLSDHLVEALYLPAEQRVVRRLDGLCEQYGPAENGRPVRIPLTQTEIGELCGASRATTNRVLQGLVADGLATLHRGRVEVRDRRTLHERAAAGG
ncbi:CRP-like cAMP-binding protein [Phycicoccus badiiscoriae]|uniref:CRP-like cAMP-binding protein n=1 Tax=Pedococcus badiiscoriae TaxID=642776 RepID=A0A852WBN8_9MICO|nr:Crp/Fnr family transcriptional regulator [Pedococcus badiiscoriae]NYG06219.1 CRP-like cAMP-binding protein [Pedococcus badiiscoriae]